MDGPSITRFRNGWTIHTPRTPSRTAKVPAANGYPDMSAIRPSRNARSAAFSVSASARV
jgi:hypothetical protein